MENESLAKTIRRINKVSGCFCLAKWKQVTVHLHTGQTHSCHHPGTHTVPLKELEKNPSALHNTEHKKELRKMMLEGKRPKECQYCWNIEDLGPERVSDRHIKSHDDWARPYLDEVRKADWRENTKPSSLEVSFSNTCNFKCLYCYPHISSQWQREVQSLGPILLDFPYHGLDELKSRGLMPIPEEGNPYIEAFWKWLPEIYPSLHVLRVTGGEPLLSKHTLALLDYLGTHPHERLEFALNSNMGLPTAAVGRFLKKLAKAKEHVRTLRLYTSVDTWGPQAEYIRTGMNLELFEKNVRLAMSEIPDLKLTFMCTFNALSVFSFRRLLETVLEMKQTYASGGGEILLDISYLRNPEFLSVLLLQKKFHRLLKNSLRFMEAHSAGKNGGIGFIDYEIEKMRRLVEYTKAGDGGFDLKRHRRNFVFFTREMDRRRGTDFPGLFPDLAPSLKSWSGRRATEP